VRVWKRQRTGSRDLGSRPALGRHPDAADPQPKASHRRKKAATPVRTGLLGVSAAVALGTVAVASGLVPGAENYSLGGGSDKVESSGTVPSGLQTEGGTGGTVTERESTSTSRDTERSTPPTVTPSPTEEKEKESKKPSATPSTKEPSAEESTATPAKPAPKAPAPSKSAEKKAPPASAERASDSSEATAAAAEVLKLVNEERSKVGCSALTESDSLAALATAFSEDMAARGFFDHVDPSGADPWDRAAKAGITSLGGENIARGQGTAQAVMDAWMNSPGHKANILNCDFKTLGVGVHFGEGGPWWTQDFGY